MTARSAASVLEVDGLTKHFPVRGRSLRGPRRHWLQAVDDVSFSLASAETLGIVGESGCGKSTLGRTIAGLYQPTAGRVRFDGQDVAAVKRRQLRSLRRGVQMVFQDPYASLDPRMAIADVIRQPLRIHRVGTRQEQYDRVSVLAGLVGLDSGHLSRHPHELSGGQRQRVAIARALALKPSLVVCDEPMSALDVSIQAQVLALLRQLQSELGVSYLLIAHDLSMVRHLSHRVGVMYLGRLVELAPRDALYADPLHPYTQALLSAVPVPDPPAERARKRIILQGDLPSPVDPPSGCRFRTRCPIAVERCKQEVPSWRELRPDHFVACHLAPDESNLSATPA